MFVWLRICTVSPFPSRPAARSAIVFVSLPYLNFLQCLFPSLTSTSYSACFAPLPQLPIVCVSIPYLNFLITVVEALVPVPPLQVVKRHFISDKSLEHVHQKHIVLFFKDKVSAELPLQGSHNLILLRFDKAVGGQ